MRFLRLTVLIATALLSAGAQAAFVPSWDWNVSLEFVVDPVGPPPSPQFEGTGGSTTVSTSLLEWGISSGSGQSSLEIFNSPRSSPPIAVTGGLPVPTQQIVHTNNPITGQTLDDVSLRSTITLTPSGGGAPVLASATFHLDFKETPNTPGTCVPGATSICDDIFVLAVTDPLTVDELGRPVFTFPYEDFVYKVTILSDTTFLGATPLGLLSSEACNQAGAPSPICFGFLTPEGSATTAAFAFQIAAVPEPGPLALLGLGLFGVAWSTRRRRS